MSTRQCNKPYTNRDKWIVASIAGLLFLLIASPFLFSAINNVTESFGLVLSTHSGYPNIAGLLVNATLYMLIVRLLIR